MNNPNFNSDLLYTAELQLAEEVANWLVTSPGPDEILEYIGKLPNQIAETTVDYVATIQSERLFEKKEDYLSNTNPIFLQSIDEVKQSYYLGLFEVYSSKSVAQKLQQKFPALQNLTFPPTINIWASEYNNHVETLLIFCSALNYLQIHYLCLAIQKSVNSFDTLDEMQNGIEGLIQAMQDRYQSNRDPSVSDQRAEIETLSRFTFLAESTRKEMVQGGDTADKLDAYEYLFRALIYLNANKKEGILPVSIGEDILSDSIWEGCRQEILPDYLARCEYLRQVKYHITSDEEQALDEFNQMLTVEKIKSGHMVEQVQQVAMKYGQLGMEGLIPLLYQSLRTSTLVKLLIKPYDIDYLLNELKVVPEQSLEEKISLLKANVSDPSHHATFAQLMKELFSLTHTFKEPNV